eukprot:Nk52_evm11s2506 gene=Nk52_evmTU11s2506
MEILRPLIVGNGDSTVRQGYGHGGGGGSSKASSSSSSSSLSSSLQQQQQNFPRPASEVARTVKNAHARIIQNWTSTEKSAKCSEILWAAKCILKQYRITNSNNSSNSKNQKHDLGSIAPEIVLAVYRLVLPFLPSIPLMNQKEEFMGVFGPAIMETMCESLCNLVLKELNGSQLGMGGGSGGGGTIDLSHWLTLLETGLLMLNETLQVIKKDCIGSAHELKLVHVYELSVCIQKTCFKVLPLCKTVSGLKGGSSALQAVKTLANKVYSSGHELLKGDFELLWTFFGDEKSKSLSTIFPNQKEEIDSLCALTREALNLSKISGGDLTLINLCWKTVKKLFFSVPTASVSQMPCDETVSELLKELQNICLPPLEGIVKRADSSKLKHYLKICKFYVSVLYHVMKKCGPFLTYSGALLVSFFIRNSNFLYVLLGKKANLNKDENTMVTLFASCFDSISSIACKDCSHFVLSVLNFPQQTFEIPEELNSNGRIFSPTDTLTLFETRAHLDLLLCALIGYPSAKDDVKKILRGNFNPSMSTIDGILIHILEKLQTHAYNLLDRDKMESPFSKTFCNTHPHFYRKLVFATVVYISSLSKKEFEHTEAILFNYAICPSVLVCMFVCDVLSCMYANASREFRESHFELCCRLLKEFEGNQSISVRVSWVVRRLIPYISESVVIEKLSRISFGPHEVPAKLLCMVPKRSAISCRAAIPSNATTAIVSFLESPDLNDFGPVLQAFHSLQNMEKDDLYGALKDNSLLRSQLLKVCQKLKELGQNRFASGDTYLNTIVTCLLTLSCVLPTMCEEEVLNVFDALVYFSSLLSTQIAYCMEPHIQEVSHITFSTERKGKLFANLEIILKNLLSSPEWLQVHLGLLYFLHVAKDTPHTEYVDGLLPTDWKNDFACYVNQVPFRQSDVDALLNDTVYRDKYFMDNSKCLMDFEKDEMSKSLLEWTGDDDSQQPKKLKGDGMSDAPDEVLKAHIQTLESEASALLQIKYSRATKQLPSWAVSQLREISTKLMNAGGQ